MEELIKEAAAPRPLSPSLQPLSSREQIEAEINKGIQHYKHGGVPKGLCVIYAIVCIVTGMAYIGQTYDRTRGVRGRFKRHMLKKSKCRYISRALQRYGSVKFRCVVVNVCSAKKSTRNAAEVAAIARYNTLAPSGYNLQEGGSDSSPSAVSNAKHKATCAAPEFKAKMAPVVVKSHSAEANAKRVKSYKETAATPEFKTKKSDIQSKLWKNQEYVQNITDKRDISLREKLDVLRSQASPLPPVEERTLGAYYIDDKNQLRRWRKGSRLDKLTIEVFEKERVRARAKNKRKREGHGV